MRDTLLCQPVHLCGRGAHLRTRGERPHVVVLGHDPLHVDVHVRELAYDGFSQAIRLDVPNPERETAHQGVNVEHGATHRVTHGQTELDIGHSIAGGTDGFLVE